MREFEASCSITCEPRKPEILNTIATEKALSDDTIAALRSATEDFKAGPDSHREPTAAAAAS